MSYVNSAGTRVDGPPVIEQRYQGVHLSESGAMPLVNTDPTQRVPLPDGRRVLWGGREHVEALQDVWVTLTPLAQKMVRELFPVWWS